jgi:type II secretory pathway pseudopilin PulG
MVALLIGLSVMSIMLTVAMPVWKTASQREKEAELIFRGQQYVRAIELYQRKMPGAAPPNLDVLLDQKFLRKKYKDPVTGDDFQLLSPNSPGVIGGPQPQPGQRGGRGASGPAPGPGRSSAPAPVTQSAPGGNVTFGLQAGISGVVSKSKASSLRLYNGRNHYNEWQFVHIPRTPAPGVGAPGTGAPGTGVPGVTGPGSRGGRGGRSGPGGFGPVQPGVSPTGRGGRGAPPPFPPGGMPPQPGRGPGGQPVFPR